MVPRSPSTRVDDDVEWRDRVTTEMGQHTQTFGAGDDRSVVREREHVDAVVGPAVTPCGEDLPGSCPVELLGAVEEEDADRRSITHGSSAAPGLCGRAANPGLGNVWLSRCAGYPWCLRCTRLPPAPRRAGATVPRPPGPHVRGGGECRHPAADRPSRHRRRHPGHGERPGAVPACPGGRPPGHGARSALSLRCEARAGLRHRDGPGRVGASSSTVVRSRSILPDTMPALSSAVEASSCSSRSTAVTAAQSWFSLRSVWPARGVRATSRADPWAITRASSRLGPGSTVRPGTAPAGRGRARPRTQAIRSYREARGVPRRRLCRLVRPREMQDRHGCVHGGARRLAPARTGALVLCPSPPREPALSTGEPRSRGPHRPATIRRSCI